MMQFPADDARVRGVRMTPFPDGCIARNGTVPGYVLADLWSSGLVSDPLISKDHDVCFRHLARLGWSYNKKLWVKDSNW